MHDSILLPKPPKVVEEKNSEATIEIEGLHPGYGITLGNALKRVLHSSLPGAAITSVKIDGAQHEFSTLPSVLEDVLTILLNLKQVRFKMFSKEPQTVTVDVKGEREVTAGDIQCPSTVEVVNPGFHIAALTDKTAEFKAEFTVETGVGYVTRETSQKDKVQVGMIALDAIFTPVRKVRYEIENMRVGTATNYNRLRLSLQTDGSLTPKEAFIKAVEILEKQLKQLRIFQEEPTEVSLEDEKESARQILEEIKHEKEKDIDAATIPVEDLKLSSRTINALTKANLRTVGGVMRRSAKDLLALEGIGEKALTEIQRALGNFGIILPHED